MSEQSFHAYSDNYEKVHDQHLPLGVESEDFLQQRVALVLSWKDAYFGQARKVSLLDFGCGNGRTAELFLKSESFSRYVGVDEYPESLRQAALRVQPFVKKAEFITEVHEQGFSLHVEVCCAAHERHKLESQAQGCCQLGAPRAGTVECQSFVGNGGAGDVAA